MVDSGVCAVQPVLPVLRGAVGLPAVLQDAGQGEPGLQGLPSGKPTLINCTIPDKTKLSSNFHLASVYVIVRYVNWHLEVMV